MPTLLRAHGLRFFFFSNEGSEPPHVHVECGQGVAKFWLGPVSLAYSTGMKPSELRLARQIVEQHQEPFLAAWSDHFDP